MDSIISGILIYITSYIAVYAFTFNKYTNYKYCYIVYSNTVSVAFNDKYLMNICSFNHGTTQYEILKLPIKNNIIISMLNDNRYSSCYDIFKILVIEDLNKYI